MKTREGRIITLYNANNNDTSWTHKFMIVDVRTYKHLATPFTIPDDFEKNFNSLHVLVEVDNNDLPILDENGKCKLHKKTMNIREYLSFFGPSKEIKQRMSNGQIKINNKVVKSFDVECAFDYDAEDVAIVELADFLMDCGLDLKQLNLLKSYAGLNIMDFFGTPTIQEGPTNIHKFKFLEKYILISVSKREHYVVLNDEYPSRVPYQLLWA